jgi:hypothetical protein
MNFEEFRFYQDDWNFCNKKPPSYQPTHSESNDIHTNSMINLNLKLMNQFSIDD